MLQKQIFILFFCIISTIALHSAIQNSEIPQSPHTQQPSISFVTHQPYAAQPANQSEMINLELLNEALQRENEILRGQKALEALKLQEALKKLNEATAAIFLYQQMLGEKAKETSWLQAILDQEMPKSKLLDQRVKELEGEKKGEDLLRKFIRRLSPQIGHRLGRETDPKKILEILDSIPSTARASRPITDPEDMLETLNNFPTKDLILFFEKLKKLRDARLKIFQCDRSTQTKTSRHDLGSQTDPLILMDQSFQTDALINDQSSQTRISTGTSQTEPSKYNRSSNGRFQKREARRIQRTNEPEFSSTSENTSANDDV